MAQNPIIPGFAPDPSIVRIGGDFFLVTSSFHLFPGLPIYTSTDLVSWTHIGNAINSPTQLSLAPSSTLIHNLSGTQEEILVGTGGLYAPTIRHHNGRTYIVSTNVRHLHYEDKDKNSKPPGVAFDNFLIYTDDIWSDKWSDPISFEFHGIDPDLFIDDDGRVYISGSSWNTTPSTINCVEIDLETGQKLSPERVIWEGFMKVVPEGPHIYKCRNWYYLLAAEGGTHEDHQLSIARSKIIWGPYESCPSNPILPPATARNGYQNVQYNGHGDLFQDGKGNWWLVFLAVRKDPEGRCVMGRETFICPVQWPDDEWPVIMHPLPLGVASEDMKMMGSISTLLTVNQRVGLVWIRDPDFGTYDVSDDASMINMVASTRDLDDRVGPHSFVGRRQRALDGQASVTLLANQGHVLQNQGLRAGLAYYKDEHRFARIEYDYDAAVVTFEMKNAGRNPAIHLTLDNVSQSCFQGLDIQFRIEYTEQVLRFGYRAGRIAESGWVPVGTVDTLDLTDRDFTGPCIGVFALDSSQ
ncbi:glycosyl hydrolase [Aspergillus karnatakaensis]|uniref:putative xylosidase/arabinosidase n=1 Tax=Aspergillus karnatakaensis TaxID=1810916 RepID=UPI003CCD16CF